MRASVVISALVAALVGFGSTLALIVAAAQAVGANAGQTASWVTALCLSMAVTSTLLSIRHRIPAITAWSTPGAALIAASQGIAIEAAVGAFVFAACLVLVSAALRPLNDLIARLPTAVAAGMLAGVLIQFVLAVFEVAPASPELVLPLLLLFFLARLFSPAAAVLLVLGVGVALTLVLGLNGALPETVEISELTFIWPSWEPGALLGLGLPLFLVTMASQNLPGFAVLKAAGYRVPGRSILSITGLASLATAPFGAHASNLAAITAAICTGPECHPDAAKRWLAGPVYGAAYLLLALFGSSLVLILDAMPAALVITVAGVALLAPLTTALGAALDAPDDRLAAVVTLCVTASGIAFFGIGSAFWGLMAGLALVGLERRRQRRSKSA